MVYSRGKIGKTFLIRKYFKAKFNFEITAKRNESLKDQLEHFMQTIVSHRYMDARIAKPESWMEAFQVLIYYSDSLERRKKILSHSSVDGQNHQRKPGILKSIKKAHI